MGGSVKQGRYQHTATLDNMATQGRKRRTDEWIHFFCIVNGNKTLCKVCGVTMTGKKTSNLKRHLLRKHPELYNVSMLKVEGTARNEEDEPEANVKAEPCSLPIVSSSFNLEPCQDNSPYVEVSYEQWDQYDTNAELRPANIPSSVRDEDELFLFSLLPSLKRLNHKKRMEVRMEFQRVLYAAEYQD